MKELTRIPLRTWWSPDEPLMVTGMHLSGDVLVMGLFHFSSEERVGISWVDLRNPGQLSQALIPRAPHPTPLDSSAIPLSFGERRVVVLENAGPAMSPTRHRLGVLDRANHQWQMLTVNPTCPPMTFRAEQERLSYLTDTGVHWEDFSTGRTGILARPAAMVQAIDLDPSCQHLLTGHDQRVTWTTAEGRVMANWTLDGHVREVRFGVEDVTAFAATRHAVFLLDPQGGTSHNAWPEAEVLDVDPREWTATLLQQKDLRETDLSTGRVRWSLALGPCRALSIGRPGPRVAVLYDECVAVFGRE